MIKKEKTYKEIEETINSFERLLPVFNAIGDSSRQKILIILGRNHQMNVKELTQYVALSRPAISHHLKQLKTAGLVDCQRKGNENYYYLVMKDTLDEIKHLIKLIEETCQV